MKKSILSIFLIFFYFPYFFNAQKLTPYYNPDSGYGYKDDSGQIIIEPKYEEAFDFENSFAAVKLNDKWGFINSIGKEVIECQYQNIREGFSKYGFARVYQNDFGYLFIDTTGKPTNFTRIYDTLKNRAWVDFTNGGMGIIDLITREEMYKCFCDGESLQFTSEGLMKIYNPDVTYIDIFGKEFFIPYTPNQLEKYRDEKGKFGFIKYKLSEQDDDALYTKEFLPAKYDTIYQVINYGDFWEEWSEISKEGFRYVGISGKKGLVDSTGKEITPIIYDWIDESFWGNEIAKVSLNKKFGFIDKSGKEIIKPIYSAIGNVSEGLIWVKSAFNGNFGYIDTNGKIIIDTTLNYLKVSDFVEEMAVFQKEIISSDGVNMSFYGFIDKSGNEVISPKYDYAEVFQNGRAVVGRYILNVDYGIAELFTFYIDKNGIEIK